VLVETRGFDRERPSYVLGVGLNVAQRDFPPELERPATSLALEGVAVGVPEVERALLDRLAARLAQVERDLPRLASDFAAAAGLAGAVRAVVAGGEAVGELVDLSLEGGLRLRDAAGRTRHLALEHLRRVEPA
jgi:biotin-(acetyl-CoA carboxylase) ligase